MCPQAHSRTSPQRIRFPPGGNKIFCRAEWESSRDGHCGETDSIRNKNLSEWKRDGNQNLSREFPCHDIEARHQGFLENITRKATGKVVRKQTRTTHIKTHKVAASKDNPEYIVESTKSGERAAHKRKGLKKV